MSNSNSELIDIITDNSDSSFSFMVERYLGYERETRPFIHLLSEDYLRKFKEKTDIHEFLEEYPMDSSTALNNKRYFHPKILTSTMKQIINTAYNHDKILYWSYDHLMTANILGIIAVWEAGYKKMNINYIVGYYVEPSTLIRQWIDVLIHQPSYSTMSNIVNIENDTIFFANGSTIRFIETNSNQLFGDCDLLIHERDVSMYAPKTKNDDVIMKLYDRVPRVLVKISKLDTRSKIYDYLVDDIGMKPICIVR